MGQGFFDAARSALQGILNLLVKLALPLGLAIGLIVAAWLVAQALRPNAITVDRAAIWSGVRRIFGLLGVVVLVVCVWRVFRLAPDNARALMEWKEMAEASENPLPEAAPVYMYGPVVAKMVEKTYTRTLTLPPDFLQRIGSESLQALSPYLTDPTANNVKSLTDRFEKQGLDVQFTRELTRVDEEPIPLDRSEIEVTIKRLQGEAFEYEFVAKHQFSNPTDETIDERILLVLPASVGTIRNLRVAVGDEAISEPDDRGYYVWKGKLAPGERREATMRFSSIGETEFRYDISASRRAVKSLVMTANVDGPVQYVKGSIMPTKREGNRVEWNLADVVTNQSFALRFPKDVRQQDALLQSLRMLPTTLILFSIGLVVFARRMRFELSNGGLALSILLFSFGLAASFIVANYAPVFWAMLLGPMFGLALVGMFLDRRFVAALTPIALIPLTSVSPTHSGLWMLLLAALALVAFMILGEGPRMRAAETVEAS